MEPEGRSTARRTPSPGTARQDPPAPETAVPALRRARAPMTAGGKASAAGPPHGPAAGPTGAGSPHRRRRDALVQTRLPAARPGSASATSAPSPPPGRLRRASARPCTESSAPANPGGSAGSRHAGARASEAASELGPARPRPAAKWRRRGRLCRYRAALREQCCRRATVTCGCGPRRGLLRHCPAAAEPLPSPRVAVAGRAPRSCALRTVLRAASRPPPA